MERAVVDLQRGRGRWAREGYGYEYVSISSLIETVLGQDLMEL